MITPMDFYIVIGPPKVLPRLQVGEVEAYQVVWIFG